MATLFSTGMGAFKFGFGTCTQHILRWLALTVVLIIPILNFLGFGILLKVLRGEDPTFENGGKSFVQGFLAFVIALIYSLIPIGIQMLTMSLGIAGIIISLVVFILFYCVMIPAMVNYARKQKFIAAFMFPEMLAAVRKMTWSRFILALLFFIIVELLVTLILYVIMMVPVLGWIVMIVVMAPLALFQSKYWHDIFE